MIFELGAYRIYGHNGNFIKAAKECGFNHAYVGPGADGGSSEVDALTRAANLGKVLKKLTKAGFSITLDLERHSPFLGIKPTLKAAKPYWSHITRVVLADEAPQLDYHTLGAKVAAAQDKLGLPYRPFGATFTPQQVFEAHPQMTPWAALDFVGIEAYCDIPLTTSSPISQVGAYLTKMRMKIARPLIVIAAAYNRNGAFTDPSQIVEVNRVAWAAAEAEGRPLHAFAFGRAGGLKDLKFLQEWYRERANG